MVAYSRGGDLRLYLQIQYTDHSITDHGWEMQWCMINFMLHITVCSVSIYVKIDITDTKSWFAPEVDVPEPIIRIDLIIAESARQSDPFACPSNIATTISLPAF